MKRAVFFFFLSLTSPYRYIDFNSNRWNANSVIKSSVFLYFMACGGAFCQSATQFY